MKQKSENYSVVVNSFDDATELCRGMLNRLRMQAEAAGETFRVIDVGGGQGADKWEGLVDTIVDLVPNKTMGDVDFIKVDIDDHASWLEAEEEILKNGKYDFCICNHTLEDLNNPRITARWLGKIAKKGFIGVPTYLTEMIRSEDHRAGPEWDKTNNTFLLAMRGYTHHRWIIFAGYGTLLAYPKMSWLDSFPDQWFTKIGVDQTQFGGFFDNPLYPQNLCAFWEGELPFMQVNPSLTVEKRWGNSEKLERALNIPDVGRIMGDNDTPAEQLQDWTFLSLIVDKLGFNPQEIQTYKDQQKQFIDDIRAAGYLQDDVTDDDFPWYTLLHGLSPNSAEFIDRRGNCRRAIESMIDQQLALLGWVK